MIAKDVAAWQSERSHLRADADATRWLIARLVRDQNNTVLAEVSDMDRAVLVAGIRDMHRSVYGVPLFEQPRARTDHRIAERIDCYAAMSEHFANAIVLSGRMMP